MKLSSMFKEGAPKALALQLVCLCLFFFLVSTDYCLLYHLSGGLYLVVSGIYLGHIWTICFYRFYKCCHIGLLHPVIAAVVMAIIRGL